MAGHVYGTDGVDAFTAVDARWRQLFVQAMNGLTVDGRVAFDRALGLLDAGPAPRLLPTALEPDDLRRFNRESDELPRATLTKLGVLVPAALGFDNPETAVVQGLITAVHRLIRIAKTRS
jgi:hypothetical protein